MSTHREISQPTELLYTPRPSWGPAMFAAGLALIIVGAFPGEFMVPLWIYGLFGAVLVLASLRVMIGAAVRDFFRLPRRQRVRGAVLPAATLRSSRRD